MEWDFNYLQLRLSAMIADASAAQSGGIVVADYQRILNIIKAMTTDERANGDLLLDRARRERIAHDASVSLADVDELIAHRQALAILLARLQQ